MIWGHPFGTPDNWFEMKVVNERITMRAGLESHPGETQGDEAGNVGKKAW